MIDIHNLPLHITSMVAQNLGWEGENAKTLNEIPESIRTEIEHMSAEQVLRNCCEWELGRESWATWFITRYEAAVRADIGTRDDGRPKHLPRRHRGDAL